MCSHSIEENNPSNKFQFENFKDDKMLKPTLKSGRVVTEGHVCSEGVPRILNIWNSWSISESPTNNGQPVVISAKIVPIDHKSMGQP